MEREVAKLRRDIEQEQQRNIDLQREQMQMLDSKKKLELGLFDIS